MTQAYSKARQQAESVFGHVQSQMLAKGRAVEEIGHLNQTREAKTQRLREARLAKEASALAATGRS